MGTAAECVMHSLGCGRKAEVALEMKAIGGRDFSEARALNELAVSPDVSVSERTITSAHTQTQPSPSERLCPAQSPTEH